jgi:GMP synthase (glutamine-hydrolysing)
MKPILVLQHMRVDGPAYLATWLREQGLPFEVRLTGQGEPVPANLRGYAGLAVLGGAMSVNDPLPYLRDTERLIRLAMEERRPVIGHCLGGQLMARALGARVQASPAPEIGWQGIEVRGTSEAARWFGPLRTATVMQWHYEAFELPDGATALASSAACPVQAFSVGPHLAMQFHIEIDAPKLAAWVREGDPQWERARLEYPASVQDAQALHAQTAVAMAGHQQLARQIYAAWARGLNPGS